MLVTLQQKRKKETFSFVDSCLPGTSCAGRPLLQRRWEAASGCQAGPIDWVAPGETCFSPAAPRALRWTSMTEGREETVKEANKNIEGMKEAWLLLTVSGLQQEVCPPASGCTPLRDFPSGSVGHRQYPKCYTHTSSHSMVRSFCTLLSAAVGAGLVIRVFSEKWTRVCG